MNSKRFRQRIATLRSSFNVSDLYVVTQVDGLTSRGYVNPVGFSKMP